MKQKLKPQGICKDKHLIRNTDTSNSKNQLTSIYFACILALHKYNTPPSLMTLTIPTTTDNITRVV